MTPNLTDRIPGLNWKLAAEDIHTHGYSLLNSVITHPECENLIADYHHAPYYRKTIKMERYRFGIGEYKYFQYPLPDLIQTIRSMVYEYLAPIANKWMAALHINIAFPDTHTSFQNLCREKGQTNPTALILKYGPGGYNTLHQDLYGEIFFPIQAVLFLSQSGLDFTGGEFVLTQQNPRAQSKAIVLQPNKGDMLLFTTNFRPVKGTNGYHRVNMKHGVSPVKEGKRFTLGIIFHEALQ